MESPTFHQGARPVTSKGAVHTIRPWLYCWRNIPLDFNGYRMYHTFQHSKYPHSAYKQYVCVLFRSQNKPRLFPYSWSGVKCAYCAVRTASLYATQAHLHVQVTLARSTNGRSLGTSQKWVPLRKSGSVGYKSTVTCLLICKGMLKFSLVTN